MALPFNINLHEKVIVVTGAGGVLCSCFAKALAACGAKVALFDINEKQAQEYADQINADKGIAKAYACNVLEKDSVERAYAKVREDFGSCDILINGAGGNNPKATTTKEYFFGDEKGEEDLITFFDLDPKGIEFVFNLNYLGTLIPTQVIAGDMAKKEGCSIINISSMNAFCPLTKIPAYSGAKAAISNFTQWLAVHFSKVGIRVNAIAPGFFVTIQNQKLLFNEDGSPTARTQKILSNTPMERFGKAEELIGALLFLASNDASSFVTGTVVAVDGGFSAYSGV